MNKKYKEIFLFLFQNRKSKKNKIIYRKIEHYGVIWGILKFESETNLCHNYIVR